MKYLMLGLVTAGVIASAAIPANAGPGDSGNVQRTIHGSSIDGNDNFVSQQTIQSALSERYRSRGDFANIQEVEQFCDAFGNRNQCIQQAIQDFRERRMNTRPRPTRNR